jgi:alginate O-acetyltransferase complex protein AlgI
LLFSEPIFLFFFLPAVLGLYFVLPARLHNAMLLLASLFFYGWGEPKLFLLLPVCIALNWWFGLWIGRTRGTPRGKRALFVAVAVNLGVLVVFKYADFVVDNVDALLQVVGVRALPRPHIALPLGVSFFTFQAMSYVIDVYRGESPPSKSWLALATWKSFFPQLIAGPIVRYRDLREQLVNHAVTRAGFALGVERFVVGLAKKMIVANTVAAPADRIFALPLAELSTATAWLGVVCYAVQIYFDFSGYSDMAIGLGHMFGFRLLENFAYPYASRSITEFWRRWHISLSSWFRDYLYIPLGGNRGKPWRTWFNLLTVFALCGFWHGASWVFVVWGLFHGAFLVLERLGLGRALERVGAPLCRVYTLVVVLAGWVFFRAETLPSAVGILRTMAGLGGARPLAQPVALFVDPRLVLALVAGAIGSAPFVPWLKVVAARGSAPVRHVAATAGAACVGLLLVVSAMLMAAGTYNPFIYFRF